MQIVWLDLCGSAHINGRPYLCLRSYTMAPLSHRVRCADIAGGNVKSILQLFFNLSRYKQQQKLSSSSARRHRTHSGSGNRCDVGMAVKLNTAQHSAATTRSVPVERRCLATADVVNGNVDMTSRCAPLDIITVAATRLFLFVLYYNSCAGKGIQPNCSRIFR